MQLGVIFVGGRRKEDEAAGRDELGRVWHAKRARVSPGIYMYDLPSILYMLYHL